MTSPSGCAAWADLEDLPDTAVGMHAPTQWCDFLQLATDVLWAATGRRWRGGPLTGEAVLRAAPPRAGEPGWPYSRTWGQCSCYSGVGAVGPVWSDGVRSHYQPTAIRLPHPDVVSVSSVTIDAAVFEAWRVDGPWLARTDGDGWPMCSDRTLVTYLYGRPPPAGGRVACVELALEFGRNAASDPDKPCSLPKRLTSITRQGISFAALDSMEFLDQGLTGLYVIDTWITAVNPHRRKQAATVWSPELMRARRTT